MPTIDEPTVEDRPIDWGVFAFWMIFLALTAVFWFFVLSWLISLTWGDIARMATATTGAVVALGVPRW